MQALMKRFLIVLIAVLCIGGCGKTDKAVNDKIISDSIGFSKVLDSIQFKSRSFSSITDIQNSKQGIVNAELPKVTIARLGNVRKLPTAFEMDLLMYNPIDSLQISIIKWNIVFYDQVLSNPRLEGIDSTFNNYKQVIDIYQPGRCNIYLLAKTKDVPILNTTFIVKFATLKFDRVVNGYTGYGMNGFESYIIGTNIILSQMYL